MVEVEEKLVVKALDVFQGRDDLLKVLVLGSSEDRVVDLRSASGQRARQSTTGSRRRQRRRRRPHHDAADGVVVVGLDDGLLDALTQGDRAVVGLADEPEVKRNAEGLARPLGELRASNGREGAKA